jgi:hypothetical protein
VLIRYLPIYFSHPHRFFFCFYFPRFALAVSFGFIWCSSSPTRHNPPLNSGLKHESALPKSPELSPLFFASLPLFTGEAVQLLIQIKNPTIRIGQQPATNYQQSWHLFNFPTSMRHGTKTSSFKSAPAK